MATVSEFHLEGASSRSSGEQLMAETDSEDGYPAQVHHSSDALNGGLHERGITGTIRNKETVVIRARQRWKIVVPRHDFDLDTPLYQTPQLVIFETNIDANDLDGTPRGMLEGGRGIRRVSL